MGLYARWDRDVGPDDDPPGMIDNAAWLAGYEARRRGEGCPWNDSGRAGWLAAKNEEAQ